MVLFRDQILEMGVMMDLHVLSIPESENHIFRDWSMCVSVSVYIHVSLCVFVIRKIQKQLKQKL